MKNSQVGVRIDPHDLGMVSYHSNALRNHKNAIYAIDNKMQSNYTAMLDGLRAQLDPVIVVQSDGQGGTYTLIHEGISETVEPVAEIFQLVKSVAHCPLGIYVILAPYLQDPSWLGWVKPLNEFKAVIEGGLGSIGNVDLPADAIASSTHILQASIQFIDGSVAAGKFSISDYETYTASIADDIFTNMQFAAKAQVDGVEALLERWKAKLGEEAWRNVYAIVLAIWTTELKNQNWLVLNKVMDQSRVADHLITIGIASFDEDTVQMAIDNLARIVQDNVAASMIFPSNTALGEALRGPEDLLAAAIEGILSCPHAAARQRAPT